MIEKYTCEFCSETFSCGYTMLRHRKIKEELTGESWIADGKIVLGKVWSSVCMDKEEMQKYVRWSKHYNVWVNYNKEGPWRNLGGYRGPWRNLGGYKGPRFTTNRSY